MDDEYQPRRAAPGQPVSKVDFIAARAKAIVAFVGAVLTFATGLPALGLPEWVSGVAAVLTFIGVYMVPNRETPLST